MNKLENGKKDFVKQFEKDQKQTEDAVKAFNIDEFTGETDKIYAATIPKVGVIKYKLLSYDELQELHKKLKEQGITDLQEQGLHVIAEMMHKVDEKTTPEKLHKLSGAKVNNIVSALGKASGFL